MTPPTAETNPVAAAAPERFADAETLRILSHQELLDRYLAAPAPTGVAALDGDPAGLGLGLAVLAGTPIDRLLRRRARRPGFGWHGKSFRSQSRRHGYGFNRLRTGPVTGALAFSTQMAASRVDGRPTIALDFDLPRNPRLLRATLDELREVLPGIYMGPTGIRARGRYRPLAWFAVDTTQPVELVEPAARILSTPFTDHDTAHAGRHHT
jgi:hypothetical protein